MARDQELLDCIVEAKQTFGKKCAKYAGACTVEALRAALDTAGLPTSARDVFIRAVPVEIDLLIPRAEGIEVDKLVYDADDVLVALEVKNSGSFGESTLKNVRDCFQRIHEASSNIECLYVTVAELRNYRWRATRENLQAEVYTLFWHNSAKRRKYEATGDWERLLAHIRDVVEKSRMTLPAKIQNGKGD